MRTVDCGSRIATNPGALRRALSRAAATIFLLGGALISGCGGSYITPERMDNGLVVVLTGIGGRGPLNEAICEGLAAGGVDWAIELYDWTSIWGPLYNLSDQQRNRRKAQELAARIMRYRMSRPGRPVILVGQSGGGAVAVWTAEEMPPGHELEGLILLAPALSSRYMLDEALGKCRRGIASYHSSRDWFILGVGTTVYGTMDGERGFAAGFVGFELPLGEARLVKYQKLHQIAWTRQMAEKGHSGIHFTTGAVEFVSSYVAPFISAEKWDFALIRQVMQQAPSLPGPATGPAPQHQSN